MVHVILEGEEFPKLTAIQEWFVANFNEDGDPSKRRATRPGENFPWLTTMLKRRKMLARGNELVAQHRRELFVSEAHPRSIPRQNIRRL